jgi:hypothetical protein
MAVDWKKVGRAVADAAPALGGLLGGPAGATAGALIASTLGSASDPDAVLEKLKLDPDALMKIRQLEYDEREHIRAMQIEALRLELADVQSARATHANHWMPSMITGVLALMVGCLSYYLITQAVPNENREMVVYVMGQLTGMFNGAVTYWIGTSVGSARKTDMLANK